MRRICWSSIYVLRLTVLLRPRGSQRSLHPLKRGGRVHETLGRLVKELDELRGVLRLPQLRHRDLFDLTNPLLAHPQHLADVAEAQRLLRPAGRSASATPAARECRGCRGSRPSAAPGCLDRAGRWGIPGGDRQPVRPASAIPSFTPDPSIDSGCRCTRRRLSVSRAPIPTASARSSVQGTAPRVCRCRSLACWILSSFRVIT